MTISSATPKSERALLRQQLRRARNALSNEAQQESQRQIVEQCFTLPACQKAKRIAAYLANDGEVNLDELIHRCWKQRIGVSLPVLHPVTKKHLLMLDYKTNTPMQLNRFGIAEPMLACNNIRLLQEHDIIFMPLVGFDASGNRLGMGGGFYDRTLAFIRQYTPRPRLFGIAHDCQQVDSLPFASWDIPLDAVITPSQVIHCIGADPS